MSGSRSSLLGTQHSDDGLSACIHCLNLHHFAVDLEKVARGTDLGILGTGQGDAGGAERRDCRKKLGRGLNAIKQHFYGHAHVEIWDSR